MKALGVALLALLGATLVLFGGRYLVAPAPPQRFNNADWVLRHCYQGDVLSVTILSPRIASLRSAFTTREGLRIPAGTNVVIDERATLARDGFAQNDFSVIDAPTAGTRALLYLGPRREWESGGYMVILGID